MLTIEINDAQLEQKIIKKAQKIGKSVQDLFKDWIIEETQTETKLPFEIPKLDYKKHIRTYNPSFTEEDLENINDSTMEPFTHVKDTLTFSKELRKKAWGHEK